MYLCARKLHFWQSRADAQRCCNGWVRLMVPFHYGVPGRDWYSVVGLGVWKVYLIREEETAEIEKLRALLPMELRSSTSPNPWLKIPQ